MPVEGSTSHYKMQGTKRHLQHLMRRRRLWSVRNSYETREATFSHVEIKETYGFNYPESKPHFFSSDEREKTGVLRDYCKVNGSKNICWVLGLVQGCLVIRRQINSNEDVKLRAPWASYEWEGRKGRSRRSISSTKL